MQIITAQCFATSGDVCVFGEAPYENNRVLSRDLLRQGQPEIPRAVSRDRRAGSGRVVLPQLDRQYALTLIEISAYHQTGA